MFTAPDGPRPGTGSPSRTRSERRRTGRHQSRTAGRRGGSPEVPKLLLTFEGSPTLLIGPETADWCATHLAGLETVHCGPAGHHATEDRPAEIAAAVSAWADRHGLR
ncbi:hypothetical protein [Streptomyces sp. NPDC007905]|uniref:hypothetical protein n=1 Tax=Streptomyces sp. NPDC007905 TaxID=3364788 RepID=UPI0036E793E1